MPLSAVQFRGIVDALSKVIPFSQPTDVVMSAFFRGNRKFDSSDRQVISETVYATLRRYYFLSTHIAPDKFTPVRLAIASLLAVRGHNLHEISNYLTEGERVFAAKLKNRAPVLDLVERTDLPAWVIDKLAFPEASLIQLGQSLQQAAPMDLRVNTFKSSREKVMAQLINDGIQAVETPWSPIGIRLKKRIPLQHYPLFLEGAFEVQDEGSQLLGLLVDAKRKESVVDFCAGAGGKTLLLSAAMNNSGQVYAFDVSKKRLDNLSPRLKRSGLSNINPTLIRDEHDERIKRLHGRIDRVLVDAPCTGMGTLRRNPDLKFRQSPQSLQELNVKQRSILSSASRLLKPGGRLVYSTCSLLPDENETVVEEFLANHSGFRLLPIAEALPDIAIHCGDYLKLYPHLHQTDGFFAAVMVRNK